MEFLQELNEQQKQAVLANHPRICVIAGPGCGKTRTLIFRAIYLLNSEKVKPQQILILTFAKKAIKEIKKRIVSAIGINSKNDLNIANFHSFCYQILRENSHLLGFGENELLVYDRRDQETIIKKIIYNLNYNYDQKEIRTILTFISLYKNSLDIDSLPLNEDDRKRHEIYQKYQEHLKENKALDFNDLLIYTIMLFQSQPGIKDRYQEKFKYVLVDEFQDVNDIQWFIVQQLVGEKQNLFLVGDPNQAIYGFQGASPELISSFTENQKWKIIYLKINYRSTNNILGLANSFVNINQKTLINNSLLSTKENGQKVIRLSLNPRYLVRQIRWIMGREKVQLNDIAILYRNNYLSTTIEQELIIQKIPYEILGAFKFIEREEIKDVLAFLRIILYQDNLSLLRVFHLLEGIGYRTIEKLEQNSEKEKLTIYHYLNNPQNIQNLLQERIQTKQMEKILTFLLQLNNYKEKLEGEEKIHDFISQALEAFAYWKHLENKINAQERKKNIQQLLNIAENWERKRKNLLLTTREKLNAFLQYFLIAFEDRKMYKGRNNLILSSIHQAKGLEFEVVIFVYLDEDILPYKGAEDLTEETRIFYVGITRAKKMLFLVNWKTPSPFLEEVDKSFWKEGFY